MTNPEILKTKAKQMKAISEKVDNMSSRMRNQQIFWAWLETVVEVDQKDYLNEPDYGYPKDIKNLTFISGLSQIDLKQHQENLDRIESFQSEMSESIAKFTKFWQLTQKDMNNLYTQDTIEELKEMSDQIIEELDDKLPSVNGFIKLFDQYKEEQKEEYQKEVVEEDILVNHILQFLNYKSERNSAWNQNKNNNQITTEDANRILKDICSKQKQQQEQLKNHINHIFDSISNVVTAYPNVL